MLHRFFMLDSVEGDRLVVGVPGADFVLGVGLEDEEALDNFETNDPQLAARLDALGLLDHELIEEEGDAEDEAGEALAAAADERQEIVLASREGEATPDGNAAGDLSHAGETAEDFDADIGVEEAGDFSESLGQLRIEEAERERLLAEQAARDNAENGGQV